MIGNKISYPLKTMYTALTWKVGKDVPEWSKDGVEEADGNYHWEYTEGPGDKAFMEAQDRRYLIHIARPSLTKEGEMP